MNKKIKHIVLVLFAIALAAGTIVNAQAAWHKTPVMDGAKVDESLVEISVPAEAEYNGKKVRASVFIFEHIESGKSGVPKLGIYVEDDEDLIPGKELSKFVGPELSQSVISGGTFELTVNMTGVKQHLISYAYYANEYPRWFDPGFDSSGRFELSYSKINREKWKELVTKMSGGFTDADITIGGKVLPHKLHIHFAGSGLGSQLKDLMQYCEK